MRYLGVCQDNGGAGLRKQRGARCFVNLTFRDGTVVCGYFGAYSLTATDPDRSDIYLERLYTFDDGWHEAQPPRGVWVSLADLRLIEFICNDTAEGA